MGWIFSLGDNFYFDKCFDQNQGQGSNLWVFEGSSWGDWLGAGKSPTRSTAELAPVEPAHPPQPNLQRHVFLVSKGKDLYKIFVQDWICALQPFAFLRSKIIKFDVWARFLNNTGAL